MSLVNLDIGINMQFRKWLETFNMMYSDTQLNRKKLYQRFPRIKGSSDLVNGLRVTANVDNMNSIASSLTQYEILPGIRRVKMEELGNIPYTHSYSVERTNHVKELAEKIKKSNRISPLIVVIAKNNMYILEGSHRIDALDLLQIKEFPALIVVDTEEL